VLGELAAGHGHVVALPSAKDPARKVDGRFPDWRGGPSGFGGSSLRRGSIPAVSTLGSDTGRSDWSSEGTPQAFDSSRQDA
jgi:hypothetical protein